MSLARFDAIKLIWRPEPHTERRVVGTLGRDGQDFSFRYDGPDLERAQTEGFRGYPGLSDFARDYDGQAMVAFSSRLPSRERADIERLLAGWGANPQMDDFTLLGLTFGRLPTDMYEFIPEVMPLPGTTFYSDLAGIRNYAHSEAFRSLPQGSPLDLIPYETNDYDPHAVKVTHNGEQVAHVKRVHADSVWAARDAGLDLSCQLIRVRLNGVIQEALVEISYA